MKTSLAVQKEVGSVLTCPPSVKDPNTVQYIILFCAYFHISHMIRGYSGEKEPKWCSPWFSSTTSTQTQSVTQNLATNSASGLNPHPCSELCPCSTGFEAAFNVSRAVIAQNANEPGWGWRHPEAALMMSFSTSTS